MAWAPLSPRWLQSWVHESPLCRRFHCQSTSSSFLCDILALHCSKSWPLDAVLSVSLMTFPPSLCTSSDSNRAPPREPPRDSSVPLLGCPLGECPISVRPGLFPASRPAQGKLPGCRSSLTRLIACAPSLEVSQPSSGVCAVPPPTVNFQGCGHVFVLIQGPSVFVTNLCPRRVTNVAPAGMEGCPFCSHLGSKAHAKLFIAVPAARTSHAQNSLYFSFQSLPKTFEIKMKPSNAENSFIQ